MTDAYVYQAAVFCERCALQIRQNIEEHGEGHTGIWPRDIPPELSSDSETWPQGPYAGGGGESDHPQHCDHCHAFLQNPLTPDGVAYVKEQLASALCGDDLVLQEWQDFYGISEDEEDQLKGPNITTMNKAQQQACHKLWQRHAVIARHPALPGREKYSSFRRRFSRAGVGSDVYFFGQMPGGVWLGIESDGHCHT